MKVTEKYEYKGTSERVAYLKCDFCGKESKNANHDENPWETDGLDTDSVTIQHKQGNYWGNDGDSNTLDADMCPSCFRAKLLPWLRANAVGKLDYEYVYY